MQRQKKEQGQITRQTIIDVTTRLFASLGYSGTSLDLIAKEANTSKSSIFWHFENKEDLLFTVVDRAMSDWEIAAGSQILAQPDPPAQLEKLIELYRELAVNRPDTLRLLLGLLLETADANDKVKHRFQKMYRGYRASIQIVLEEGIASGDFTQAVPPSHLAGMILALFDGLFIQWFLDPEGIPAELFDSLKRSVFNLIMPRKRFEEAAPIKMSTPGAIAAEGPALSVTLPTPANSNPPPAPGTPIGRVPTPIPVAVPTQATIAAPRAPTPAPVAHAPASTPTEPQDMAATTGSPAMSLSDMGAGDEDMGDDVDEEMIDDPELDALE